MHALCLESPTGFVAANAPQEIDGRVLEKAGQNAPLALLNVTAKKL